MRAPAAFEPGRLHRPDWYVQRDGEWRLRGSWCKRCSRLIFPAARVCSTCWPDAPDDAVLPDGGELVSWSRVEVAPAAFDPPYVIGYVDVAPGVRLFGQVDAPDEAALTPGMRIGLVLGVIRRDADGPVWGYRFSCGGRPS